MNTNRLTNVSEQNPPKILHSIREASHALSLSRSKVYELIQCGTLKTVKIGQRRLVPASSLSAFVNALVEAA